MRKTRHTRVYARVLVAVFTILMCIVSGSLAQAATQYNLKLGPSGLGNGGPNPLGIPPSIYDLEIGLITQSGYEASLGIPGLLFGKLVKKNWGGYISVGGGLVIDANGAGPGVYSAIGCMLGKGPGKALVEYKQAIGIGVAGVLSPYALRVGIGLSI